MFAVVVITNLHTTTETPCPLTPNITADYNRTICRTIKIIAYFILHSVTSLLAIAASLHALHFIAAAPANHPDLRAFPINFSQLSQ
jgi:hypothetical protein